MRKIVCYFLIIVVSALPNLLAQKESYNWYFGSYAGITFNTKSGSPVAMQDGRLNTVEGCATVSDKIGRAHV